MRFQGRISNWNDDKGFGFVEPNGGGKRAFVHIKAFNRRTCRPVNGEIITYELVHQKNNRYVAQNIKFTRDTTKSANYIKVKNRSRLGTIFTLSFCVGLIALILTGKISALIVGAYCVMSALTFITYAIDKSAAKNGRWRTPEKTLHIFALLGGWPGAFFAQNILRHKSIKNEFRRVFWATVFLNLVGIFWLYSEKGISFMNAIF
jgi:uncharacterized membrane protein YsdA (DUF1294 family)/cold shock CspA family protein